MPIIYGEFPFNYKLLEMVAEAISDLLNLSLLQMIGVAVREM